jgi:formylglycine-generating enzyme required for sulfatase activity
MRLAWGLCVLALLTIGGCQGRAPDTGADFRDCTKCPVMVRIPGGRFEMGKAGGEEGRPEGPVRTVRVAGPLAIGKFEVTQEQFAAFVSDTRHTPPGRCRVWNGEWAYPEDADWTNPGYGRIPLADEPVACVTWRDAQAYVTWLAAKTGLPYRLLTEAEWEYAARGGTDTDYFWGDDPDQACEFANVYDQSGERGNGFAWDPVACDDSFAQAAPVGSFAPNAFGLYDMIGNVWEWTQDCYRAPYPDQPVDGRAYLNEFDCARRSVRGGSWITRASRQRVSFRGRDPEDTVFSFFGFRVARDL